MSYRRLSATTTADIYPLPLVDGFIDSSEEAQVFTELDALSEYLQVPIKDDYEHKTVISSHFETYRCPRTSFGLRIPFARFHRSSDIILVGILRKTCLAYIDDFVNFSKNNCPHVKAFDKVLTFLCQAGVALNLRKYHFSNKM